MNAKAHVGIIVAVLAGSCSAGPPPPPVDVASTTSIVDTGLADGLARRFLDATGIKMRIQAVGSGQAFALGRRGESDLLLVHDPDALETFREERRVDAERPFARSDFVLAGPADDPAGTARAQSLGEAFRLVAAAKAAFVSRADRSGTNAREESIWESEHVHGVASEPWYVRTGQGMAETLRVAGERSAYVLTDSATLTTLGARLRLRVLVARGPMRDNVYTAVVVRYRGSASGGARRFLAFLARPSTKAFIARYRGGLFRPLGGSAAVDLEREASVDRRLPPRTPRSP